MQDEIQTGASGAPAKSPAPKTNGTGTDYAKGIVTQMKEMVAIKDSFNEFQLKFVKGLINPDLTDNELYMFLMYAGKTGLNPFNKEIIAVVYYKDDPSKRRVNTITTRDGKRATAYRQGGIEGVVTEPIYITIKDSNTVKCQPWEGGKLWGATCTVNRNGKAYTATVPLAEYNTSQNVWASKPETMIKKVAESQAFSAAVPELLGVYDESEMPDNGQQNVAIPAGMTDRPATENQIETIKTLAEKAGVIIDTSLMTAADAAKAIAELAVAKKGKVS